MSSYLKKLLLFVMLVVISKITTAQDVEMADAFRQDGKIYVVIAVVCILFAVIFGYLIYLDNKINKLKK